MHDRARKGNPIVVIQGAHFGSEAKGAAALALCERLGVKWVVRTGSINAGHTVYYNGNRHVFQQLPVGALLPNTGVVIGPGAYVSLETMASEVEMSGCRDRLLVDKHCGVHLDDYTREAAVEARNLRIGATGKGCAEAIVHKIGDRGVGVPLLLKDRWGDRETARYGGRPSFCDTAEILTDAYHSGQRIMLEGTQGTLLDLHCGPYPYVTSRQTIASAWVAEAGLSPALDYEVILVARTYPIRVAGNSGPMGREISWPRLARRMNARLRDRNLEPIVAEEALREFEDCLDAQTALLSNDMHENGVALYAATYAMMAMSDAGRTEIGKLFETTTVTKRLRRVAELDVDRLRLTVKKEQPAYLILTFLNYVFPELAHEREIHDEAMRYISDLQEQIRCHIRYVTIGPRSEDMLEVRVSKAAAVNDRRSIIVPGPAAHWLDHDPDVED